MSINLPRTGLDEIDGGQVETGGRLDGSALGQSILATLAAHEPSALFATELQGRVQSVAAGADELEDTLRDLAEAGAIVVTAPPAPDAHLAAFDLRIVALVPPDLPPAEGAAAATRATDILWGRWLREFLASHRCQ